MNTMVNTTAAPAAIGPYTQDVIANGCRYGMFLKDMAGFAVVNQVYAEYCSENFPARSCVQVAALPKDALVEIEVIASL